MPGCRLQHQRARGAALQAGRPVLLCCLPESASAREPRLRPRLQMLPPRRKRTRTQMRTHSVALPHRWAQACATKACIPQHNQQLVFLPQHSAMTQQCYLIHHCPTRCCTAEHCQCTAPVSRDVGHPSCMDNAGSLRYSSMPSCFARLVAGLVLCRCDIL